MNRVVHCKKSPYDVYIGRPTKFGNPFFIGRDGTREEVVEKFEKWARSSPEFCEEIKRELASKVLGCWCAPLACHGDVLVKIADE